MKVNTYRLKGLWAASQGSALPEGSRRCPLSGYGYCEPTSMHAPPMCCFLETVATSAQNLRNIKAAASLKLELRILLAFRYNSVLYRNSGVWQAQALESWNWFENVDAMTAIESGCLYILQATHWPLPISIAHKKARARVNRSNVPLNFIGVHRPHPKECDTGLVRRF